MKMQIQEANGEIFEINVPADKDTVYIGMWVKDGAWQVLAYPCSTIETCREIMARFLPDKMYAVKVKIPGLDQIPQR